MKCLSVYALMVCLLAMSCQAPIHMSGANAKTIQLSFSMTNSARQIGRDNASPADTRLLLPSATSLTVSLTPVDPGFPAVPSQTKAINSGDTQVSMVFADIRCGRYSVLAQAFAGGVVQLQQTSTVTVDSAQPSGVNCNIVLVPANPAGLATLSNGQIISGSQAAGHSSSWLVPASEIPSGTLSLILSGTDPAIACYIQKYDGTIISGSPSNPWFEMQIAEPVLVTLYNNSSQTANYSISVNPLVQYNGNLNSSGLVPIDSSVHSIGNLVTVLGNPGELKKIKVGGNSYRFVGWNTYSNGAGMSYISGSNFTFSGPIVLYAQWTPYSIGDTGPGGGLVFYDNGSYIFDTSGIMFRYMEVVPSPAARNLAWATASYSGSTATNIGSGRLNSATLFTALGANSPALVFCSGLTYGTYADWFLPSQDELNQIFVQFQSLYQDSPVYTWTSTVTAGAAIMQRFDNGLQGAIINSFAYKVLPVREF